MKRGLLPSIGLFLALVISIPTTANDKASRLPFSGSATVYSNSSAVFTALPIAVTNNSNTTATFNVAVLGDMLDAGVTGAIVTDDHVSKTWMIQTSAATTGGSGVDITLDWTTSDESGTPSSYDVLIYNETDAEWEALTGTQGSVQTSGSNKTLEITGVTTDFTTPRLLAVAPAPPPPAPTVTSFSPSSGAVGSTVTISGSNFSTTASSNIVYFGGVKATVSSATATQLQVTVPAGAKDDLITVIVNNMVVETPTAFIITNSTVAALPVNSNCFGSAVTFASNQSNYVWHENDVFLAVADFDGDGKNDVAKLGGNSVIVHRNTSNTVGAINAQSFDSGSSFALRNSTHYGLVAKDLNADGKVDIIAITAGYVSILINNSTSGTVSFATVQDMAVANYKYNIEVADFDGDGLFDFMIQSNYTQPVNSSTWRSVIYLNTTSGGTVSFANGLELLTNQGSREFTVGDFTGDGLPDIIESNGGKMRINTSTAGALSFSSFNFTIGSDIVAIFDIDNDGDNDLITGKAQVYVNNITNPSSVSTSDFALTTLSPGANGGKGDKVSYGDYNGDGKLDFIVNESGGYGSPFQFFLNNISGSLGASSFDKIAKLYGQGDVAMFDIDGDHAKDLVFTNSGSSNLLVAHNRILYQPTMSVTGTLNGFSKCSNIASSSQSFTVSGTNLTSNITVDDNGGHLEYSSDNSTWSGSLSVAPTSGSISNATVYVRVASGVNSAVSTSNINVSTTGVTTENVAYSVSIGTAPAVSNETATAYSGAAFTHTPTVTNGATGVSYTWTVASNANVSGESASSSASSSIGQTLTLSGLSSENVVYTVTPTGACAGNNFTLTVTVEPVPALTSASAMSGYFGEEITLTGTTLSNITSVTVGGESANFTVNSATEIVFDVPANSTGNIVVSDGTNTATLNNFTYITTYVPIVGSEGNLEDLNNWTDNPAGTYSAGSDNHPGGSSNGSNSYIVGASNQSAVLLIPNRTGASFDTKEHTSSGTSNVSFYDLVVASGATFNVGENITLNFYGDCVVDGTIDFPDGWTHVENGATLSVGANGHMLHGNAGHFYIYSGGTLDNQGVIENPSALYYYEAQAIEGTIKSTNIIFGATTSTQNTGTFAVSATLDESILTVNSEKITVRFDAAASTRYISLQYGTLDPNGNLTLLTESNKGSSTISDSYWGVIIFRDGSLSSFPLYNSSDPINLSYSFRNKTLSNPTQNHTFGSPIPSTAKVRYWNEAGDAYWASQSYYTTNFYPSTTIDLGQDLNMAANGSLALARGEGYPGGFVKLNQYDLTWDQNAIRTSGSPVRTNSNWDFWVITNSTGRYKYYLQSSALNATTTATKTQKFYVGNSAFNPITITNNSNTEAEFAVGVFDHCKDDATSTGGTIGHPVVNRMWEIEVPNYDAGNGVDLTFEWDASEESASIANYGVFYFDGSDWQEASGTLGSVSTSGTTNTVTLTGCTEDLSSATKFSIQYLAPVLNVNYQDIDLDNLVLTSGTSGANASVYRQTNAITVNGTAVDVVLTITDKSQVGSNYFAFDDASTTDDARLENFQPKFSGTSNSVTAFMSYKMEFVMSGTNAAVQLYNFKVSALDVDGEEYVQMDNPDSYELDANTALTVSLPTGTQTRFSYPLGNDVGSGILFDDATSFIAEFTSPITEFNFTTGASNIPYYRLFSLRFGAAAGSFTTTTSGSVALTAPTVTASTATTLTHAVTGTWGGSFNGSDALSVQVDGTTYTAADQELTITGTTWSLVPGITVNGTYDVTATATRSSTSGSETDATSQELTVSLPYPTVTTVDIVDYNSMYKHATITGTNLSNLATATLDGHAALSVIGVSNTEAIVILPANQTGNLVIGDNGGLTATEPNVSTANASMSLNNDVNSIFYQVQNAVSITHSFAGQYHKTWKADMNGDGILDVINGQHQYDFDIIIIDANGDLTNVSVSTGSFPPSDRGNFAVLDLDNDGDLDLAWYASPDKIAAAYNTGVTNGLPTFGTAVDLGVSVAFTNSAGTTNYGAYGIESGDIDADGDVDIMVFGPNGASKPRMVINDGNGGFTAHDLHSSNAYQSISKVVDWNGDGLLDILVPESSYGIQLYTNQGVSGNPAIPSFTKSLLIARADLDNFDANNSNFEVVDLDGDGHLDIVFNYPKNSNGWHYRASIAKNTSTSTSGAQTFAISQVLNLLPANANFGSISNYNSKFVDVDGDNVLDILSTMQGPSAGDRNGIGVTYITFNGSNQAQATFQELIPSGPLTQAALSGTSYRIGNDYWTYEDITGDGEVDYVAGYHRNKVMSYLSEFPTWTQSNFNSLSLSNKVFVGGNNNTGSTTEDVTLTLSSDNAGYFTVSGTSNATIANNNTGTVTVTGPVYEINRALATLAYKPTNGGDHNFTFGTSNRHNETYSNTALLTVTGPQVASTATSIADLAACPGTASGTENFDVSGTNLTSALTVTAPTGMEVSTSASTGFATSVSLTPTSGTVSATTIYARMASTATTAPTGNIVVASGGASTNVALGSNTLYNAPDVSNQTVTISSGQTFNVTPTDNNGLTGTTYTWTVASNANVSGESDESTSQSSISQTLSHTECTDQTVVYTVTPTGSAGPAIGDTYGGGTVAYIFQPGDAGYSPGKMLIIGTEATTGGFFGDGTCWTMGTGFSSSTDLGTGATNTANAYAMSTGSNYATTFAATLTQAGYSDWFLPSKDELQKVYDNRASLNRTFVTNTGYRSSSIGPGNGPLRAYFHSTINWNENSGGCSRAIPMRYATYTGQSVGCTGDDFTVTVTVSANDVVAPVVGTQNVTVYLDASGNGSAALTDIETGTTDNCASHSNISFSLASGSTVTTANFTCSDVGSNTVTVFGTDPSGNVGNATATVTVVDTISPVTATQSATIYLNGSGVATLTTGDVDNGSADACTAVSLSLSKTTFTAADLGQNTVVLTATDSYNNSKGAAATVTVVDNTPPTMAVQNVTVYLDGSGAGSLSVTEMDNGTTDNDQIASLSFSQTSATTSDSSIAYTCSDLGAHTVTLYGNDPSSNQSNASATITVVDTIAPVVAVQAVTVQLDANGNGSVSVNDVDNGTSDNCTSLNNLVFSFSASTTATTTSYTCSDVGTNTVTLHVTDASGNRRGVAATVTVEDNVKPVVSTQNVTIQLDANGVATTSGSAINNGSTDACGIQSYSMHDSTFSCDDLGPHTVYLRVTDVNGNIDSAAATVTVVDVISPTIAVQNVQLSLGNQGSVTLTGADVDNGSSDNCSFTWSFNQSVTFSCNDLGAHSIVATITDPSGNTDQATFLVTVVDGLAPVVVTQPATLYLNANAQATLDTADVISSINENCSLNTISLSQVTFNSSHIGANTVTLTVTDAGGNTTVKTAVVTVVDNVPPVAATQDITLPLSAGGTASITYLDVDNGSSDNVGITSYSINTSSFTCSDLGVNWVVLTVEDASGNTDTAWSKVTVVDNIAPTALANNFTVALDANGNATITAGDLDAGSTDNCSVATLTASKTSFTASDMGANAVTLTVTDGSGNTSTAIGIVTIADQTAPTVVTQNATLYLDANGAATLDTADVISSIVENVSIASITLSETAFGCNEVGANTVTLTVTDGSGNSTAKTATVTVVDNIAPIAGTQDITLNLSAAGTASIAYQDVETGSSDNCGISTYSINTSNFTCSDVGVNWVVLTVADASGNSDTAWSKVTVVDNIAPTALAQNITVALDANASATITVSDVDAGSSDNCSIATTTLSKTSFTASDLGANTVTLTVTDATGNVSTATAVVTIVDNTAPTVVTQNATLYLDANGAATLDTADVISSIVENVSIASITLSETAFGCNDLGVNTVTLTVVDGSGNSTAKTATVTVVDNIGPTAAAQNLTLALDANGMATVTAADVDNGSSDNCGIVSYTLSQTSFSCTSTGTHNVTLTVADASGNTATATAVITVVDNTAPTALANNISVSLDANGAATITASDVDGGSYDNCSGMTLALDQYAFSCSDYGQNTVTLTATDAAGNTSTAVAIVTIEDHLIPSLVTNAKTLYLDANGAASLDTADVITSMSDNCSIDAVVLSQDNFTCAEVGANLVTVTVSDASGNNISSVATVTVMDTLTPTITNADTVSVVAGASCMANAVWTNTIADNCSYTVTNSHQSGAAFSVGHTNVITTVTDASGNSVVDTMVVEVLDTIAPMFTSNAIVLSMTNAPNCGANVTWAAPTAIDWCSNVVVTSSHVNGSFFAQGTHTVTFTATDDYQNTSTITLTFVVTDNIAPVVTPPANIAVNNDAGVCGATVTLPATSTVATDNCTLDTVIYSPASGSFFQVGTTTVTITAIDSDGNTATGTFNVVVTDTEAPVNTYAPNDTVLGYCDAAYSFTAPQFTDNCGIANVTLINGVASGNTFPAGLTENIFVATDLHGNVDTVSFTVTVIAQYPATLPSYGQVCSNDAPFDLSGGDTSLVFSGDFVDNNFFNPQSAGPGQHSMYYVFTDSMGCESTHQLILTVEQAPTVPVVVRNSASFLSTQFYHSYQWYFYGNPIAGATSQTLNITQGGFYRVRVWNTAGCSELSDPLWVGAIGLEDFDVNLIQIYPNPTSGIFTIDLGSLAEDLDVTVYDATGKRVYTGAAAGGTQTTLDFTGFAQGIYQVVLTDKSGGSVTKRISIQN